MAATEVTRMCSRVSYTLEDHTHLPSIYPDAHSPIALMVHVREVLFGTEVVQLLESVSRKKRGAHVWVQRIPEDIFGEQDSFPRMKEVEFNGYRLILNFNPEMQKYLLVDIQFNGKSVRRITCFERAEFFLG